MRYTRFMITRLVRYIELMLLGVMKKFINRNIHMRELGFSDVCGILNRYYRVVKKFINRNIHTQGLGFPDLCSILNRCHWEL